ncbi:MAG: lytic transglycosylase domain-containing protein [Rhodocyclaceae bacterium]
MNKSLVAVGVLVAVGLVFVLEQKAGAAMLTTTGTGTSGGQLGQQNGSLQAYSNFRTFDPLFIAAGQKYGVDPLLLKAIALHESSLNPAAANTSNPSDPSYGLMQMSCMPDGNGGCLASEFNLRGWPPSSARALFNPATSIDFGAQLLAQNLRATGGNVWEAVAMYNSGSTYDPAYVSAVQAFYTQMGG